MTHDDVIDIINKVATEGEFDLVTEDGIEDCHTVIASFEQCTDDITVNHIPLVNDKHMRAATIPANVLCVGSPTNVESLVILHKGTITTWTVYEGMRTYDAPTVFVAPAGYKRIGYTHTECEWANVYDIKGLHCIEDLESKIFQDAVSLLHKMENN